MTGKQKPKHEPPEAAFRALVEAAPVGLAVIGEGGRAVYANRAAAALFGEAEPARLLRRARFDTLAVPGDRGRLREAWRRLLAGEAEDAALEWRGRRRDGTPVALRTQARRAEWGGRPAVQAALFVADGAAPDEAQRSQAQKMEAIGQLTGGLAHDFNNLLAIVQGNIAHLERQLDADSGLRELTAPALRATRRAAELTHRLLAFSRRQPLREQIVDVGALVLNMQELLRRSLGQQVTLEIAVETGLRPCRLDPAQLEQAILNLAINARDAMPRGGRLSIGIARPPAGQDGEQLAIAVSDTGAGMTPDVKARAFEPFFTTKPPGKGTGLGLSMVFGFVRQSNGRIDVVSAPGLGSTFTLLLPCAGEAPDGSGVEAAAPDPVRGSGQTILLVEDDADLRRLAALLLRGLDYRVHEAADAQAALRHLDDGLSVDLLLTDIGLARGVDGPTLAALARRRRPALKTLFMSARPVAADAEGELAAPVLSKPFEPEELAAIVAAALAAT